MMMKRILGLKMSETQKQLNQYVIILTTSLHKHVNRNLWMKSIEECVWNLRETWYNNHIKTTTPIVARPVADYIKQVKIYSGKQSIVQLV